tara:strand:- start:2968 stop:4038 length:1071 start_codon:yes stop_codon:yes gene_type:complete
MSRVFQEFDQDALEYFNLEEGGESESTAYGLCISSSTREICTIRTCESSAVYEKIRNLIRTETTTLATGKSGWKRACVISNTPVSLDRLKSALKEHSITLTNDIENADVIITHDNFHENFSNGNNILSRNLMGKLWNYETFSAIPHNVTWKTFDNYIGCENNEVIYDDKVCGIFSSYNMDAQDSLYDCWYFTGASVNIAHKIALGLPVITSEDVINASAYIQAIDEQLLKDVVRQVTSYNEEDQAIASKLLPTICPVSNPHLLWKLGQEIDSYLYKFNRSKDVQYWIEQSQIRDLANKTAEDMILWLEEEEKLNNTNFRYLEPLVRKEITISNRDLYVFKVAVKPEYRKFLKKINS